MTRLNGKPDGIVCDDRTPFTGITIVKCPYGEERQLPAGSQVGDTGMGRHDIDTHCPALVCMQTMRRGKPQQNVLIKSINCSLRPLA
jgi:hypothetical protein